MLLTLCLPSMASAQNVAKIGSTQYASLQAAFDAVADGQTVEITVAGTYTVPSTSKNITVQGDVAGVVFNHTTAGNIAAVPNGITFKNVTFNFGNVNYHGFQGTVGAVNMDNCTLNGKFFSYGDMNFTNCQFVQDNEDYHMWVYGKGTVTYTDCTFTNNVIGKFLNLYSESSENVGNVVVKNCKFINKGTESKAAINVKATSGSTALVYTLSVDNKCTVEGAFPAAGVKDNSDHTDVISALVQVDDRKVAASSEKITVNVENVPVYQAGAETEVVKINTVDDLKAFRDAVNSGTTPYAGKIVRLMADLDLSSEANWTPIGNLVSYPGQAFKGTFDGNGHIISNLTVNDNTPNYAVAALFGSIAEGSIVNLTVKDVNVTSTHYAAGIVAYTSNTPSIINCHVVGGTITSTPELVDGSYDNGDKAGGIMGYCTAGTIIKDCTVEGVTITAYRDLAGICGYANGSVTDCTVKDVTVVQDNTNAYKDTDQASTAREVVGRSDNPAAANAANTANTKENVTVKTVAPVAKIGTTQYGTLQAAIDAAQAGDVVELLKDFDLTTVTTTPSDKYNVNINKSITIDGKGYKVTSSTGKRALALTGEGNNITLKNLTVESNVSEACVWIANNLTCTLDAVTLDGTNGKTYNQPLTIGSIDDEGRVTLNVTNGSVIKTNDAGSAHYAILAAHPADITVTNSSLIGWANVYLKSDAAGSKVNISNSTLKSQGIAGASASNNFSMFTTESGNNTITLTDNNISLTPAADTYMTLVTFNGTANNTVKVQGDQTTFTTTDVTRGGITHSKGDLENNTVSFDEDAHSAFAEAINVLKNEGVSDTEAEGVYTLGYVAEVYYYWYTSGVEKGGNYDFAEPFKNSWLDNGEFIRLRKDVTLSENLTWAKENASFTLTLGEYSVTKGEYSVALKKGVTVNTDKQTDIFTAADAANYTIVETEDNDTYTYTVTERPDVAQIGDVKYKSLAAAVAAVPTDGTQTTITMIADETVVGNAGLTIAQGKNVVMDLNGKTVTLSVTESKGSQLITNRGTLTITDSSTEQTGKLTNVADESLAVGSWPTNNYVTNVITNSGTLNIEGGTIQNTAKGSICYAIDNNNTSYDAVLNIKGGYLTSVGTVVRQFCNSTTKNNEVNVSGGTVETNGSAAMWVQLPSSDATQAPPAKLNVTGGTITGANYAFYDYSSGNAFTNTQYNLDGGTFNGMIFSYGANIAITDGTYNGDVAIKQAKPSTVSVSGGTFAGDVYTYGDNASTGFISGGTFATTTYEDDGKTYDCDWLSLLADGYVPTANADGTFSVTKDTSVAKIGTNKYATLEEAFAAAQDGDTVTLLADCAGNGIKVPQGKYTTGLTVDFGGFTYTVDGATVGSTGTETNGFQLLKDNNITFKNGTITSEKAKILVQNYSNLTLEGMTLTLNNTNYTSAYTLSNNNGEVVIDSTTINANPAGGFAFDVCRYASYPSVYVTVKDSSVINGDIEIFASKGNAKDGFGLTLEGGELNGDIVVDPTVATIMDATPEKVKITKDADFNQVAPEGYRWKLGDYNQYNLVIDAFELTDGTVYAEAAERQVAKAIYKRTFGDDCAGVFQAWMVPFDYKLTATDISNFDFYAISAVEHAEGTKMQLRISPLAADYVLKANEPYVFMPKSAVGEYSFATVNATLTVADPSVSRKQYSLSDGSVDFYGVYESASPAYENDYIFYMSKIGKISRGTKTDTKVGPCRWIFRITDANGNNSSVAYTFGFVNDDDDLTAVSDATAAAESEVVGYYTLNGQKVSEPTKGVYVVKYANGTSKKVVF